MHGPTTIRTDGLINIGPFDQAPRFSYAEAVLNSTDISPAKAKILIGLAGAGIVTGVGFVAYERTKPSSDSATPKFNTLNNGTDSASNEDRIIHGWTTYRNERYG